MILSLLREGACSGVMVMFVVVLLGCVMLLCLSLMFFPRFLFQVQQWMGLTTASHQFFWQKCSE